MAIAPPEEQPIEDLLLLRGGGLSRQRCSQEKLRLAPSLHDAMIQAGTCRTQGAERTNAELLGVAFRGIDCLVAAGGDPEATMTGGC